MLKQRFITALVALVVLAVVLFVLPSFMARIVIALLVLAGAYEWGGFISPRVLWQRYVFVALIGAILAGVFVNLPDAGLIDAIFKIALAWWLAALVWMFFFPTPIARTAKRVAQARTASIDILYQCLVSWR